MEIDVGSVKRWLESKLDDAGVPIYLLDCREPAEHHVARIESAVLAPMSQWPPPEEVLDAMRDKHVVVYCHHGARSLRVARWLCENGFPGTQSMAGGIEAWSLEIDPGTPRY